MAFFDRRSAEEHFDGGPLSSHPNAKPQLAEMPSDPAKRSRLLELMQKGPLLSSPLQTLSSPYHEGPADFLGSGVI